jgi:hypothetical protein
MGGVVGCELPQYHIYRYINIFWDCESNESVKVKVNNKNM